MALLVLTEFLSFVDISILRMLHRPWSVIWYPESLLLFWMWECFAGILNSQFLLALTRWK